MENQNNQNQKNLKNEKFVCNEAAGWSLEEMESKISMLTNHNDIPAAEDFRDKLKARVLEAHAQNNMPRFSGFKNFWSFFKFPRFSAVIAALLLIAVLGGVILNGYLGSRGKKFARVLINPAYAADDFTLTPLAADSTGVTPDSAYKLTSKEAFSTDAIASGLAISPASKADVKQTGEKEWVITPEAKFAPNSILKISLAAAVSVDGAVANRDFSWAFQVKDHFRVLNSIPGNGGKGVPTNTGIEITFSHAGLEGFDKAFSISPAAAGRFEYHGRTAVFVPTEPLNRNELYTVTVGAGLGLAGSTEKLGADYKIVFETAGADSRNDGHWFGVSDGMLQFNPNTNPFIQIYGDDKVAPSVEVFSFASADAFRAALDERDLLPRWSEKWSNYKYDTAKLNRVTAFVPKIETQDYTKLISFPTPLPVGFYLASIAAYGQTYQTLIEVNEVNALVNVDSSKIMVWVNRPGDGGPLADADISVGALVHGKTDASGAATFDIPESYKVAAENFTEQKQIYLTVAARDAVSITPIDLGWNAPESRWTYFYTDRPRYQTDDTVRFWVMARSRNDKAVSGGTYNVVLRKTGWYDYFYNPIKLAEVPATLDAYGTATGEVTLKGLRPDSYEVALQLDGKDIASRWITVLPYTKPAYSISVSADKSAALVGEQVNFTAKAEFFDGTPAAGIKMNVMKDNNNSIGKFTTDQNGTITFTDSVATSDGEYWPRGTVYSVSPEAAELGEISGQTSVTWYSSSNYTTASVDYPEKGKAKFNFKVRRVDFNKINSQSANASFSWSEDWRGSEPASGAAIVGKINRVYYVRRETGTAYDFVNKTTYKTYSYDRHEDPIIDLSLVSSADGTAQYSFATQPESYYWVEYTVKDAAGRSERGSLYAYYFDGNLYYGDYFGSSAYESQPMIEFNSKDNKYSVGDQVEATLTVGGKPVAGSNVNRFLFAKYQNGLKSFSVQKGSKLAFAFSESDIPNVQLFAAWWDGKNYRTTQTDGWWGNNYGGAIFNTNDRKLSVTAVFDKSSYVPGAAAKVQVMVEDKDGRPVRAKVNLNLVDEAYYAIVPDNADPLTSIYTIQYSGIVQTKQTQETEALSLGAGAERGGCFVAGTLITMADGTQKPIEKIKAGDAVATLDDPLAGKTVTGTVSKVFGHVSNKLVSINNGLLRATPEHMIYASGTFKTAGEIKPGDVLVGLGGKKVVVKSAEIVFERAAVYNLRVDPYHTFIANGIYVHNDKDGAVRQNFVDVGLFKTVETGADGRAAVELVMPDNVTTWRLTTQAIGADLSAGINVGKIKSTLPAWVDVVVGKEYLAGDQVTAKLRAFGTAMDQTDAVSFTASAPDLNGAPFEAKTEGKAYIPSELNLPPLAAGDYDITYSMKSAKGNDAVKLPLTAVKSFLRAKQILAAVDVVPGVSFSAPGADGEVRVTFTDASTSRFYRMLTSLGWSWGKRVDQALGNAMAADLLATNYGESGYDNAFDGALYEQADGGIALLPYGSSDLDLTARLSALASDRFDKNALRQYFLGGLNSTVATPETATDSLLGLASLGDPVLAQLELWKTRTDLSLDDKMRTALALYKMGATEDAIAIYNEIIAKGESHGLYYLLAGDNQNQTLERTAFLAELAAALGMPERDKLWAYVEDHKNDKGIEVLANLEELSFVTYVLPTLAPGPSLVEYELNGVKNEINLNGWGRKSLVVAAADIGKIKINSVKGKAAAIVVAEVGLDKSGFVPNNDVSVERKYVGGFNMATTSFADGDIIRVELDVKISRNSPSHNYQLTDILPAGLIPITSLYSPYYGGSYYWLNPFNIDGQRVSFNLWKSGETDAQGYYSAHVYYFARVKTKGTYKAEPALIQAFQDPGTINFSPELTVTVK